MSTTIERSDLEERGESQNQVIDTNGDNGNNLTKSTSCWQALAGFLSLNKKKEKTDAGPSPLIRKLNSEQVGYPRLATFMTSDNDLLLYRRFAYLQTRLLLHKQDELRELEETLDTLDKVPGTQNRNALMSRERDLVLADQYLAERKKRSNESEGRPNTSDERPDTSNKRLETLSKIETKFHEYSKLLITAQTLTSFASAQDRDLKKVRDFINCGKVVRDDERHTRHEEDILTLNNRLSSRLDALVEWFASKGFCRIMRRLFVNPGLKEKSDADGTGVTLYDRTRVDWLKKGIIASLVMAHFAGPVYLVWYTVRDKQNSTETAAGVGSALAFTCTFWIVMSQLTRARSHETLAAAAGYCAVLVVFIGNVKDS